MNKFFLLFLILFLNFKLVSISFEKVAAEFQANYYKAPLPQKHLIAQYLYYKIYKHDLDLAYYYARYDPNRKIDESKRLELIFNEIYYLFNNFNLILFIPKFVQDIYFIGTIDEVRNNFIEFYKKVYSDLKSIKKDIYLMITIGPDVTNLLIDPFHVDLTQFALVCYNNYPKPLCRKRF